MAVLADRIKELRLSNQMTQTEFGNVFGIVKSTISLYESGKSTPNDQIKTQICEYFNVSMDFLLGLSDAKSPNSTTAYTFKDAPNHLAYWIYKSGFSNDDIAEKLGIETELLEDYCNGESIPLNILLMLSEICSVSTDCLLGLRETSRRVHDGTLPFKFNPEISQHLKDQVANLDLNYGTIADILGISEEEVYYLFEYGFIPHLNVLIDLTKLFNVSADYLLCLSDSPKQISIFIEVEHNALNKLNSMNRAIIYGEMLKLLKEQGNLDFLQSSSVAAEELRNGTDNMGKL